MRQLQQIHLAPNDRIAIERAEEILRRQFPVDMTYERFSCSRSHATESFTPSS